MGNRLALAVLLAGLPFAIERPDTSGGIAPYETRVSLSGGVGYYALIQRGCEGQAIDRLPVHFTEGAASLSHRFEGPLVIGVRGGLIEDRFDYGDFGQEHRQNSYINPHVAWEGRLIGIGVGGLATRRDFLVGTDNYFLFDGTDISAGRWNVPVSGHLRIGPLENRGHFLFTMMEGVPLYAGGGYVDVGAGLNITPRIQGAVMLSMIGPYDGLGLSLQTDVWVTPEVSANARARLGWSENEGQNGVALGVGYRHRPR